MIDRQKYDDLTLGEALSAGFDTVQPKYDGRWVHCQFSPGELRVHGQTGQLVRHEVFLGSLNATLIGEELVGTEWAAQHAEHGAVIVFDIVELDGRDLSALPYSQRRETLSRLQLPKGFRLVEEHPASAGPALWKTDMEGLVFRRSDESYAHARLGRVKKLTTVDLRIAGWTGKSFLLENGGRVRSGVPTTMLADPERFVGQVAEVAGNVVHSSGKLRSPRFIRLRPDKAA